MRPLAAAQCDTVCYVICYYFSLVFHCILLYYVIEPFGLSLPRLPYSRRFVRALIRRGVRSRGWLCSYSYLPYLAHPQSTHIVLLIAHPHNSKLFALPFLNTKFFSIFFFEGKVLSYASMIYFTICKCILYRPLNCH